MAKGENDFEVILKNLNSDDFIKDSGLVNEDLVKTAISNLKPKAQLDEIITNEMQNFKKASNIEFFNSNGIVKTLSKTFLETSSNEDDLKAAVKELSKNYDKKMSKFKSLTVFTLVVRFLVPFLRVPVSGKLKKKLV